MTDVLTLSTAPTDRGAVPDSLFFVGNATVLIRCGGFTVLTDPTFVHRHESAPLGDGLSTTRLTDPAVDTADLPPLDLVLLSHFHGDHFDQVAQRDLDRDLPIVATPQSADQLQELGFAHTHALETWDVTEVRRGDFLLCGSPPARGGTATVSRPGAARRDGQRARARPHGGQVTRLLCISGDTLLHDDLEEVLRRFPDLDVGLFHPGATTMLGIMVTMDAEPGAGAIQLMARHRAARPLRRLRRLHLGPTGLRRRDATQEPRRPRPPLAPRGHIRPAEGGLETQLAERTAAARVLRGGPLRRRTVWVATHSGRGSSSGRPPPARCRAA